MTFTAMVTQLLELYCESSLHPSYAHVWVMSINALSVTIAMYCVIQFYVQLKQDLAEHKPFLKVLCIKLVIFFSFWQVVSQIAVSAHLVHDLHIIQLLISFLSSGNSPVITTGPRVSYIDVKVGIPCILLTFEMSIFSIMHIFAFPWRPYVIDKYTAPEVVYKGGFLGYKAIFDCFNPWDIIKASARGFRWLFVGARKRHEDPSYKLETATFESKGKDDALPLNQLRESDEYNSGEPTNFHPSMNPTASSSRPTTREDDYNDRASLLKHQHPATSMLPGQALGYPPSSDIGLTAPYPYSQGEQMTAGGYHNVALHSPPIDPHSALPYPADPTDYSAAAPLSMPSQYSYATEGRQRQGTSPDAPITQDQPRTDTRSHPRSLQASQRPDNWQQPYHQQAHDERWRTERQF